MNDTDTDNTANTAPSAAADPWSAASTPATAESDPWSAASAPASTTSDPWGSTESGNAETPSADWLGSGTDAASSAADSPSASLWQQLTEGGLPIQDWINSGLHWVVDNFRPFFQTIRAPIDATLTGITELLLSMHWSLLTLVFMLLAWQFAGRGLVLSTFISLALVALLGIWNEAMITLALVLTSLFFCILIGLPTGILVAANDRARSLIRPLLDAMQTTPAFVYLVPVVMLFGIGNVPGVIVTIVFALPPLIRLIDLGIRTVRPDLIEASRAYGASPWQLLWKVQLPLALPSIMAGINQALMLSLSMVVIASMIAVGGLGQMVLRGIGRLDMGLATVGGLGIVLMAIVLDRITQAMGMRQPGRGNHLRWWQVGPVGLVVGLVTKPQTP